MMSSSNEVIRPGEFDYPDCDLICIPLQRHNATGSLQKIYLPFLPGLMGFRKLSERLCLLQINK